MMRTLTYLILIAITAATSACGTRGKLKSPSQIEAAETKKKTKKDATGPSLAVPQTDKSDKKIDEPAQTVPGTAEELNKPKPVDQDEHIDSGKGGN